jgi:predicted O-methyltransferase YrrM
MLEKKMKYNAFTIIYKYLRYLYKGSNGKGHGVHSPFVYDFIREVLNKNVNGEWHNEIEKYRSKLLSNTTEITFTDLGAGSIEGIHKTKQIAQIAKTALKPKKYSKLLYRIVAYYKPYSVLEMGTSLGITTCYLAKGAPTVTVTTMEGASAVAKEALKVFNHLGFQNIEMVEGNFDNNLVAYLNANSSLGLVYIDGNHRYSPTIKYFNLLLEKSNTDTIFIFDDIHWSSEMEKAWTEIKLDNRVSLTIDLFQLGIVFLRKENKEKENFIIRF